MRNATKAMAEGCFVRGLKCSVEMIYDPEHGGCFARDDIEEGIRHKGISRFGARA